MKSRPHLDLLKRQLLGEIAYKLNTYTVTQSAMARRLGIHQCVLSEVINGKRQPTLDWYCNALHRLGHNIEITVKPRSSI